LLGSASTISCFVSVWIDELDLDATASLLEIKLTGASGSPYESSTIGLRVVQGNLNAYAGAWVADGGGPASHEESLGSATFREWFRVRLDLTADPARQLKLSVAGTAPNAGDGRELIASTEFPIPANTRQSFRLGVIDVSVPTLRWRVLFDNFFCD